MKAQGFFEFQTPILTASSPEGARDFLVPSRLHPGKFYALPQAPQQFKQLIMVAGFDRYFQIAPCFRDEDARADRSPGEFYQLDIEMSFVTQEDVFAAVEPVLRGVFEEFGGGKPVTQKFPMIPYAQAMLEYGVDKPDLRNPIVIADVTEVFARDDVTFNAFKKVIKAGGVVRAIPAPGAAKQPRSFFDKLNDWAQGRGRAGARLHHLRRRGRGARRARGRSPNSCRAEAQKALVAKAKLQAGDAVFFACDKADKAAKLAGAARIRIGNDLGIIEEGRVRVLLDRRFPDVRVERGGEEDRLLPQSLLDAAGRARGARERRTRSTIKAFQYDIVCNGVELSSGAIRNHRPDIMLKAFEIAGYGEDVLLEKFGGMYRAFQCGAPPHGGIAPGIDRIVMLLAGEENLREVVLFPMNQRAEDLMMGAPAPVTPKQLRELHIRLALPEK